jgi:hypothetical protein
LTADTGLRRKVMNKIFVEKLVLERYGIERMIVLRQQEEQGI